MDKIQCLNALIRVCNVRILTSMKNSFAIDPCQPNPCGPGECEITANLLNGYICRCQDGTVQMTNCTSPRGKGVFLRLSRLTLFRSSVLNPCESSPCGSQGRCLSLSAAPRGYMCVCQSDSITFTTIDTCPSKHFRI